MSGGCSESCQRRSIRTILTVLLLCIMSQSAGAGFTVPVGGHRNTVPVGGHRNCAPPAGANKSPVGGSGGRDPLAAFFALAPTHIRGPRSVGSGWEGGEKKNDFWSRGIIVSTKRFDLPIPCGRRHGAAPARCPRAAAAPSLPGIMRPTAGSCTWL